MASGAIAAKSRTRGLGSEKRLRQSGYHRCTGRPDLSQRTRRCIPNLPSRWLGIESTSLVFPLVGGEQNYSGIDNTPYIRLSTTK